MELVRSSLSIVGGLPCVTVRSAPALVVSGPAQRLLTLRPARSPSRHPTLYTESSDSFVASAAASIATGWSEPVPGRELHPLKSSAFHGALFRQTVRERSALPHEGGWWKSSNHSQTLFLVLAKPANEEDNLAKVEVFYGAS
jgi:hypothetical protein